MPRTNESSVDPDGAFVRVCLNCENEFVTASERAKFCSARCKRQCNNATYYAAHADTIRPRAVARVRLKRSNSTA